MKIVLIIGLVCVLVLLIACKAETPAKPVTTSAPLSGQVTDQQILAEHPDDLDSALAELDQIK